MVRSLRRPAGTGIAPIGYAVVKLGMTLRAALWTIGKFSVGVFVGTVEESAAVATYAVVEHDVFAVLSRGRGGGPASRYAP